MQRVLVLVITLLVFATPALAGQFGPATPLVQPGQFALGLGVFSYSDDWDFEAFTTDARQTQIFTQATLGLFSRWESYLRLGLADLRVDGAIGGSSFRDDYQPYGTVGIKGLFRQGSYLDFGGFAEGSYFMDYEDSAGSAKLEVDDALAVNAGLIFQMEIEGALLYAGPFFHYREADFSYRNPGGTPAAFSGTAESDSNFGGFLGIRWPVAKDLAIEAEVQLRDKVSAGAAVSFLF
ncbi:MAG: hypothetical protein IH614_04385 [Desulfuromonadales bacterium]|nr:hypothetical protein [Desulfuromonadales bacterium]